VLEVGRHGPYQLTQPAPETVGAYVHPDSPRQRHWLLDRWLGIVCIAGIVAGMTYYEARGVVATRRTLRSLNPWDFEFGDTVSRGAWNSIVVWFVAIPVLLLVVGLALYDHLRTNGEPFLLLEGISVWPSTLIRFGAVGLAVSCLRKAYSDLSELGARVSPPVSPAPGSKTNSIWTPLWCSAAFVLLVLVCFCFRIAESPGLPFRGSVSFWAASSALLLAIPLQIYLAFFVAWALLEWRKYVQEVSETPANWPILRSTGQWQASDEANLIRKLAEISKEVGRTVKYPFLVIVLMIASRHPAFDLFDWSWALIAIWGLLALFVIANSYSLRQAAGKARRQALKRLREARLVALANPPGPPGCVEQIDHSIAEVEAEDEGAFAPWTQDPLFRAIGYFAGGVGGIQLLEQLLPYV
jgi:hypothetical protein